MHCVVLDHGVPTQHNTHGKPKMISYNKNNGTTAMNKHVSKHHMQEPTKWNVDLKHNKSERGGRQPWTRKRIVQAHLPLQGSLVHPNLAIRMIPHNMHFWRI